MSTYWERKMKELEEEKKASSYWERRMTALENEKNTTVMKDDDIAPVKDDGGLDFFQKGSFEDGLDWHDAITAPIGTIADAGLGVVKGVGGLLEGVVDLGGYAVSGVADLVGADEFAQKVKKGAQKNAVESLTKGADDFLDKYSVLGRTSDAIMQGIGQVGTVILTGGIAGAAGLGAAGATAVTTGLMGLSGTGSGMSEAYEGGATDEEALKYGAAAGASDALWELAFGGLGKAVDAVGFSKGLLGGLDDKVAKGVAKFIKGQTGKNVAEFLVKSGFEGLEEVGAGFTQALAKKMTYMSETEFSEILNDENLLEQFIVGAFTSGVMQSGLIPGTQNGSLKQSIKDGTDFVTGMTQNEEAVVKREVEKRIEQAEKNGEKLTAKEKNAIQKLVEQGLDRGYISIDTIEEVLGGDARTEYDSLQAESALFNHLYETPFEKLSAKQNAKLKELQSKNTMKPYEQALKESRKKLFDSVYEQAKGDRLIESYNEVARKKQDFKADFTKVKSETAKKTLENIVNSKLANNSNEFHDFVDLMTRVSDDRDIEFDITDDKKLKGTQHQFEGRRVDGFISADGKKITINLDSPKALNFLVGHEVTHSFEGNQKLYKNLQEALFAYANTKGDMKGTPEEMAKQYEEKYEGVSGADHVKELTADMVGQYLFRDYDFITHLSANHRNVFQKVYDEIKYLVKIATAGSKAARDLERVKKQFDKVYRDMTQAENGSNTKYALENNGKSKYNKRSRYSETETLFMSWEKGSAPVGEVKKFYRFGKVHYYEKTENGCVELSKSQYIERSGANAEDIDRRAEREIGETYDHDGSTQRGTFGDHNSYRDSSGNAAVFGQAIREELPDVAAGSKRGISGYDSRNDINQTEYNDEASDESGASFVTFSNDYATVRNYMKDGDTSQETDSDPVKYSLSPVAAIEPTNGGWHRTFTTEEAMERFPNMWNVAADESEVRNPTQIVSTVNSYRKVYNILQEEGFSGTILDASSGLGYGTKAGIEEYGFDVEDIEPYPDKGYNPKYKDYSTLDKKYDVIISNAVLNVLPQDQRDALAVKMGELLNDGGRMFINVRGKDVDSLAKKGTNIHLGNMEWIETARGSYQKGFTKDELKAYLEDALGDGFTVEKTSKFGAVSVVVTKNSPVDNAQVLPSGSVTKYSLSTWTPETQERVSEDLVKAGHNKEDVDKWIKDTNSVAAGIAADKARLDFEAADNQVMLKDNQEYIKTLDASTLCAKRLAYQGTFNAIQHRMPNTVLTSDMLIDLLNIMKSHKVQTPCGVCYVESRRRHLGKYAQDWLDSYDGEYKPRLDEVTTSDGLEALRQSHPQAYTDFVKAMDKKGSSNPKVVQLRTEYRNDIMSLTPAQIRKIEAIGGLRVQSFSDFETPHLLDMMQAVMDMSAKGLHSQAYTKVPNFAWVFGDTGIKINLSLIADGDGFDSDGNLAFSSTEGMDINEAMKLRDAYSKNVGTIIVGANDKHILACMADDRIDYIIPFHRSGWGMRELELMGMDSYTDYTYGQKEHDLTKPTKVIKGVQQYAGLENLYPPDYWNYELSGKENAERYLNLCAKLNREPKFSQFLVNNGDGSYSLQPDGSTDGYWKTLIDFKMYDNDGNGAAQQVVTPNFNMTEAHRVLNEYEGGANSLPVSNKVVEEFVAKYSEDVAPVKYSLSDSDGNQLSTEQQDYFKDSVVRDENGNLKVMYHGTAKGGFNVFDTYGSEYGLFGTGSYFTDSKNIAESYTHKYNRRGNDNKQVYATYLNIKNPMDMDAQADPKKWRMAFNEIDSFPLSGTNEEYFRVMEEYFEDQWMEKWEAADEIVDAIKFMGYDGITHMGGGRVNRDGERHQVYIAFEPEQIKNMDNNKPTENPDIRYSLSEDNEGNRLTEEQKKFFKDSKIRDRNGNLRRVYHTTQNDFTVFDKSRRGEATDGPNTFLGFFFAESPDHMEQFPEFQGGRTDSYYLDMKKPMDLTNLTRESFMDIVELTGGDRMEAAQAFDEELEAEKSRARLRGDNNTSLSISQLLYNMVGDYYHADFFDALKPNYDKLIAKGYDGVIDYLDEMMGEREFVVFESNQAKLTSNTNPSADPDIRYSLSMEGEQDRGGGTYNVYGKDVMIQPDDIAPVGDKTAPTPNVQVPDEEEEWQRERLESLTDKDAPPIRKIQTVKERLEVKLNNFKKELANNQKLREQSKADYNAEIARLQEEYNAKKNKNTKAANDILRRIERLSRMKGNVDADYAKRISDLQGRIKNVGDELRSGNSPSEQGKMRGELHASIVDRIKETFAKKGMDFDSVLKNAKNLSTFQTVDNTPQRVLEKSLGYKAGQTLSDMTVNKVAQNETEGIKWLNKQIATIKQISKQYEIKPGSKESAAAQMYAEGFYVNDKNEIIEYGDKELAADFPDIVKQVQIKGLAKDSRIRKIYDETLDAINASRARNAYPEIQKLDNYFLHFRAMEDTFSRLGLPFNPNDIKAKDLPTDLNGVTADLKPGQPYFASAMHRKGKRTSFDLLGGLEKYLGSAKSQIYHIDDIQTLRALRNYVAETYGQGNGLEGLDLMTEEEAQERIKQVYGSHLSTFAKFLNEEANIIAGKTALIDRGIEGVIGRRGITFLNTINKQVGANMVGFNVSSSLTNFLSPVQAFAKTNKADFVKAFAQTVSNRLGSINGKTDGFAESSPVMIRRKGEERFHRTPYQKVADTGYVLMSAVDDFSTELIARAKYNELTRKGMDSEQAHIETDKWVSRLMGDRSLGQQPQLYNSKMLGLLTKFQLEVRNQLDSQFYDTIQDAKVSNEDVQNGLLKNAKTAAKVGSTFFQLAVAQHLFGKAFESIAGYNPAFDIISAIIKAFGWDDEEESEDTVLDNLEQGFFELMGDMPYVSTLTGGRIPISSALPIEELYKGEDQYGNEKSRWETLGEAAPYYLLPGGYGQIKKTMAGMDMFSDEYPVAGSYTDSGNLRFPVEDNLGSRVQAGIFGQYASSNARDYFDNERSALKPNQVQEFIDVGMSIQDYWKYRDGLKGLDSIAEKADYIDSLNLTAAQKNILINNLTDRKEPIDMTSYGKYDDFEEFDYAQKNPEKYAFFDEMGITYDTYKNADDDAKDAYDWAYENPDKYLLSRAVTKDVVAYRKYASDLYDIRADKDASGKTISGSAKEKKIAYINSLDIDYGARLILFKDAYEADDTYNNEIIEYLNSRKDITFEEEIEILRELGFTVTSDGKVYWD